MNFCNFSVFVRAPLSRLPFPPTHTHTRRHSSSVSLCVCVRDFATVIKFHVSFTTCYNISIWFALSPCLFLIYFLQLPPLPPFCLCHKKKNKRQKGNVKNYGKNIRSMQNSCQLQICSSPANWMLNLLFMQQEKQNKKNKWREREKILRIKYTTGRPVWRYRVAHIFFGCRRTLHCANGIKSLIGQLPNWLNDALN